MTKELSPPAELAFPLRIKSLTLPMPSPIVASTVPPEIVTAPAGSALLPETLPTYPEPMPAADAPPRAVTWPPEMTMLSCVRLDISPPPMPAASLPPVATMTPLSITILPGVGKPPADPMPAAYVPPVAKRIPEFPDDADDPEFPVILSVAALATSIPADCCPAPVMVFVPSSASATSRASVTAESPFARVSRVRFLKETDAAPESDGTTMRYSPFVEKPCTTASAEIVTTQVFVLNDQPVPELSALLATTSPLTTRYPWTVALPLSSMSNEK